MRESVLALFCVASATAGCMFLETAMLHAQQVDASGARTLNLTQVIKAARADYPAIQAAQSQQRTAQGAIGVARTAYLPRTDLLWQTNRATANNIYGLLLPQGVISNISGPVINSDVSRSAWSSGGGALLSWQPFDFGVRGARVKAAREGSEAAKQAATLTELQVAATAASAFFAPHRSPAARDRCGSQRQEE